MTAKSASKANTKPSTTKTTVTFRSAVTGRYVTPSYARSHPNTTVRETDKKK